VTVPSYTNVQQLLPFPALLPTLCLLASLHTYSLTCSCSHAPCLPHTHVTPLTQVTWWAWWPRPWRACP
jgi:hypothetical protein